jgi:hypothetical protein
VKSKKFLEISLSRHFETATESYFVGLFDAGHVKGWKSAIRKAIRQDDFFIDFFKRI